MGLGRNVEVRGRGRVRNRVRGRVRMINAPAWTSHIRVRMADETMPRMADESMPRMADESMPYPTNRCRTLRIDAVPVTLALTCMPPPTVEGNFLNEYPAKAVCSAGQTRVREHE